MLAIKGIYDGKDIKPLEPIPIQKRTEVIITFLDNIKKRKNDKDWRTLRGSARGQGLSTALLKSREEDLKLEE
jgi:hypothetical protein